MLKMLLTLLLVVFSACAAEVEVPAAPGYQPDRAADADGGDVVASSEALTIQSAWFRPACNPTPADMIYDTIDGLEGFQGCWPLSVSSGFALGCLTPTMNYNVIYRVYKQTASSADAEVYYVDSIGSHAKYRIHCSCPDQVFGGGVGCISSPF